MTTIKKITSFIAVIIFSIVMSLNVSADSKYYSNLSDKEIKDIFALKMEDIANPWAWLTDMQTYAIVEEFDGNKVYWWNAPNIQSSIENSIYDHVLVSGYGHNTGVLAESRKSLVKLPKRDNARTAMQKYGFSIPNPAYIGERPLITISVGGVLRPDSVTDVVKRIADLAFTGSVVSLPTDKDMSTLLYLEPSDYSVSSSTFESWVRRNWDRAMKKIKSNQVLISTADAEGRTPDGMIWIKQNIITDNGLDSGKLSAKDIVRELILITGENYPDVAESIVLASGIKEPIKTTRIMPYDISRMNSNDASIFKGVSDPRSDVQQNIASTGYDKIILNKLNTVALSISGKISEITIAINRTINFEFLESMGFDPTFLWSKIILDVIMLILVASLVFYVTKAAIRVVTNGDYGKLVLSVFSTMILIFISYSIVSQPVKSYETFKDVSTKVFNFSNTVFQSHEAIGPLYGDGTASEKEDTQLWIPYFNNWTKYHTGYSITDKEQNIDRDSGMPEVDGIKAYSISGVEQDLWSVVLAESFTNDKKYDNDIYRVVDRFMAPRFTNLNLDNGKFTVDVKKNESYRGKPIQTNVTFFDLIPQTFILFLVIIKLFLFYEMIFNLSMLLLNLSLSSMSKSKIFQVLKELGASMANVAIINIVIGTVIWTVLLLSGIASLVLTIFYIFIVFNAINSLSMSSNPFSPKFIKPIKRATYNISSAFRS